MKLYRNSIQIAHPETEAFNSTFFPNSFDKWYNLNLEI